MRISRRYIVLAVAALCALAAPQAAQAQANPDLQVTASLTNVGRDSDGDATTARAGELVNASASVANVSGTSQLVRITVGLTPPGGEEYRISYPVRIGAGRTGRVSLTFPILRFVPPGPYTLRVAATGVNGTSEATTTITIVE
jgi:uncharacterized protein (DUF58 family)